MMTKDFYILGTFVNSTDQRFAEEDICPQIFKKAISNLESGDEFVLHMNSVGGDVFAGFTIANMIKDLEKKGVKTTCIVEGLAASIASVVACACSRIKMYSNSFLMVHRCWSIVQGNSQDLRKEAETMEKIDSQIVGFYQSHFTMTRDELMDLIDRESWISGEEISNYHFDAELLPSEMQYKIAAKLQDFSNVPKRILNIMEEEKKEETPVENTEEVKEVKEDEEDDEVLNKSEVLAKFREYEDKIAELSKTPTNDEINKRVSGMQAKMQLQINDLTKDFTDKLNALNQELTDAKATITNLETERDNAKKELSEMASNLEAKKQALDSLNSSVLRPNDSAKVYDKESARKELASLPMSQRQKFYDEHKDVIG